MDARTISRLAIVNRGAPAMRFVRAAREHAREHGRDLRLIAVHTEAERDALVVRAADEAVSLGGPSAAPGGLGSLGAAPSDLEGIEAALIASGADAAWAGWGPLAQLPAFSDLCERLGIMKVGPGGDTPLCSSLSAWWLPWHRSRRCPSRTPTTTKVFSLQPSGLTS